LSNQKERWKSPRSDRHVSVQKGGHRSLQKHSIVDVARPPKAKESRKLLREAGRKGAAADRLQVRKDQGQDRPKRKNGGVETL